MGGVSELLGLSGAVPILWIAAALLLAGGVAVLWPLLADAGGQGEVRRRLRADIEVEQPEPRKERGNGAAAVRQRAAQSAQEFYAKADPENVARLRLQLIQAGYFDPGAVGMFFLIRFASFAVTGLVTLVVSRTWGSGEVDLNFWIFVGGAAIMGYFAPSFALSRKVKAKMVEYRNGFPDFMDLMIVCSDAGMSMEAGIERVSKELAATYPALSQNLQLVSIELRAGRSLDGALKSLADRLSLDEVRSFATLLQQSKELGTSLSGALRVFSDEMRHKRMSLAEEKAHALPAKMSVPVTVCILPVVLMIAVIPMIVRMSGME